MLMARRDPPLYSGAHEVSHFADHRAAHAPHATRFMTALQMIGSVLAIPVGLASGYSIYHANFSPEARCQSLRANIISMLDKSADASTLRMLVRRDVAAFEGSCGAVDPDAVAAFKTLLASNKRASVAAPMPAAQQAARPPAAAPIRAAKPVALPKAAEAPAEIKTVKRNAAGDAQWVASVRRALLHAPEDHAKATPAPTVRFPVAPPHALGKLRGPVDAAALPPAASVAVTSAPASDHPVPPGLIPDGVPMATASVPAVQPAQAAHSDGMRGVIAVLPLIGRVVGK